MVILGITELQTQSNIQAFRNLIILHNPAYVKKKNKKQTIGLFLNHISKIGGFKFPLLGVIK